MAIGTSYYIMNAFMEPLSKMHGWSRTEINIALMLGLVIGFISQFIFGTIVMRTGPRILMFIGPLFAGFACIMLGFADRLWQFYLLYILLHSGCMAFNGVVANTAVNNWFVLKKGNAMGIASAGMSLSGAVLPLVAMILILRTTVQEAFLWIGIATVLVGPFAWAVIRNWPEEYGLAPDGVLPDYAKHIHEINKESNSDGKSNTDGSGTSAKKIWSLSELVRTGAFWKIGISFTLILTGVSAVMSQLKPRFSDIGFDDMTAMLMMAATAFLGAIAKYVWGILCDHFEVRKVVAAMMSLIAAGLILGLFSQHSLAATFFFVILFGFAMGGVMATFPIIVADLFGRESFAAVFRIVALFFIFQMFGFVIAGQCYDRTGSYDVAYVIFAILDLVAATLILTVKRPVKGL
jgi:sugar phosphate permease